MPDDLMTNEPPPDAQLPVKELTKNELATKAKAAAQVELDSLEAEEAAEAERKRVKPVFRKHILVDLDGTGHYELMPLNGQEYLRRLIINGKNVEHVGEGENGVWCYRAM